MCYMKTASTRLDSARQCDITKSSVPGKRMFARAHLILMNTSFKLEEIITSAVSVRMRTGR